MAFNIALNFRPTNFPTFSSIAANWLKISCVKNLLCMEVFCTGTTIVLGHCASLRTDTDNSDVQSHSVVQQFGTITDTIPNSGSQGELNFKFIWFVLKVVVYLFQLICKFKRP